MDRRTFTPVMAAALFGVLLIAGLSGCDGSCASGKEHCDPAACTCEPVYLPPVPYTPAPNPDNPDDWWQTVDACTLLPADTLSRLKLAARGSSLSPLSVDYTASGCAWFGHNRNLSIDLDANPYGDVTTDFPADGQVSDISTNDGRPGKQDLRTDWGECYMTVEATSGSRLYIRLQIPPPVGLALPTEHVCDEALAAANAIAPRLAGGHSHGPTSPS
ncbi:DUF3558 family protein [Catenulispora rubra]|uniref:DUF3558 family protein n=1 Tax=Catenulispora rubra TaxID=280293 RepID=UPI00189200B4|nr:DUF3558 family protein [Catenulispora rubra]